ncbi:MAG: hypothetical protein ACNA8W_23995, partial [Bradymonadaceae bacterium]
MLAALLSWATISDTAADQAMTLHPQILQSLDKLEVNQIYGLNAADVAWLQVSLGDTRPDLRVMPFSDGDEVLGPVLTRSRYLKRWFPAGLFDLFEVVAAADGWILLDSPETSDARQIPHIASARVVLRDEDGAITPCAPYRNGRFQCGEARWRYVGPRTVRIGGKDEDCIWAHPIDKATIVITYPMTPVTTSDGRRLHVET